MSQEMTNSNSVNRAKLYQLVLFPLNNGATNVYYVLILSYIATFGNNVLGIATVFASVMVTGMRVFTPDFECGAPFRQSALIDQKG